MFVAVDFDGTCVTHEYPDVGIDIGAVPWLQQATDMGAQLILYTMRDVEALDDAVEWAKENNVTFWAINENPTQHTWTASPKVYAHRYIDDAALGTPLVFPKMERPYVDWKFMGPVLLEAIVRAR